MKVLHMISGGDSGGAKTHVFALMHALPKYVDVKIVCFLQGQFFDELQDINVPSELILQKNRFDMSVLDRLCEICRNDGIEIIHAHGARANFIASKLKRKVNIPVVTTVHSDYLLDFDGLYKKIIYTSLNVNSLKKLDYYIAVSSNFKEMLISRSFRPNSIFTVYNGMDYSVPMKFCTKEEFGKRIGLEYDPETTYVGLIGRHDRVKGHDIFLKAAKCVLDKCGDKKIQFVIAGDGDGRQSLVDLAKSLGISEKLTFAGFIKDIYSFINFIDINTLSSRCESFPYVLMEGARLKKPTISSRVGGIPDLVEDEVTGRLFENENPSDFAEKILDLVNNPDKARALGEALYDRATTRFSNDALARTHREIYTEILRDRAEKKRYDAVISGYYGFHNSGDDALLMGIVESLREQMPGIRLLVLSESPMETRLTYKTDSSKRFNPFCVFSAIAKTKLLINGGGSLIQDETSQKSLLYYLFVMGHANKMGVPVYIYANGIGPIRDKNLKIAARVVNKARMITLRDQLSVSELDRMGVSGIPVKVTADPAVVLEPSKKSRCSKIFEKEGIPQGSYFCVSVRPWSHNDESFCKKIAKICDMVYEKYGLVPILLPMKMVSDKRMATVISSLTKCRSYVISEHYPVRDVIGIVSDAHLVLAMRLHTLVYALCGCVPSIGITYDPKIDGFLDYIGADRNITAENLCENDIMNCIADIEENRQSVCDSLVVCRDELRVKAKENAKIAVDILDGAEL